jgi:hypothetical protein
MKHDNQSQKAERTHQKNAPDAVTSETRPAITARFAERMSCFSVMPAQPATASTRGGQEELAGF